MNAILRICCAVLLVVASAAASAESLRCNGQSVSNSPVTAVLSIGSYTGISWIERQSVDQCTQQSK